MDKIATMRISCNLNASDRIKADIMVEKVETFIYLGSEINSEEINGEMNSNIQTTSKFY
jgi:hypothetical protein